MRIGLIITGGQIRRWQADALQRLASDNVFFVYDSEHCLSPKRPIAHAGYYLLNLLSVRNPLTRLVPLPTSLQVDHHVSFTPETDGLWESFPASVLERIRADKLSVLIKFGMGLLRVPPTEQLNVPILSYHHGDPRRFRGRPAGFYELLEGCPCIGQVVQILSNRLDSGSVVAFAETRAHPHSWRKSLIEAFQVSPLLLEPAIKNTIDGVRLPIDGSGKNYRLPSNWMSVKFASRRLTAMLDRLAYGAFYEKRWRVAEVESAASVSLAKWCSSIERQSWTIHPVPQRYRFLADPFFDPCGPGIVAEAMKSNGRGEIVRVSAGQFAPLHINSGHCSYPSTVEFDGRKMILPEVSESSSPVLAELGPGGVAKIVPVDITGMPRLIDATLFERDADWYLFGNRLEEGSNILRLWTSTSPFGHFVEHPKSPVRISPIGSRMAGAILVDGSRLYRPGQDCGFRYGDGIVLYEIEALTPAEYVEREAARVKFETHNGPHTINRRDGRTVFDFYDDRFTPLAGLRRLRQSRAS